MNRRELTIITAFSMVVCLAGVVTIGLALSMHGTPEGGEGSDSSPMIGCLVSNDGLEKTLEEFSGGRVSKVVFAHAFGEGLLSQQCAAFVIDRSRVKTGWPEYADFINEFMKDTPLLVVDNIREWTSAARDS